MTDQSTPNHDPLSEKLTFADDRIKLSDWLPPRSGIIPRIRFGTHWVSILWAIPLGSALLILAIAAAQSLRELESVKAFIEYYPGIAQATPSIESGFPWWLDRSISLHFLGLSLLSSDTASWSRLRDCGRILITCLRVLIVRIGMDFGPSLWRCRSSPWHGGASRRSRSLMHDWYKKLASSLLAGSRDCSNILLPPVNWRRSIVPFFWPNGTMLQDGQMDRRDRIRARLCGSWGGSGRL